MTNFAGKEYFSVSALTRHPKFRHGVNDVKACRCYDRDYDRWEPVDQILYEIGRAVCSADPTIKPASIKCRRFVSNNWLEIHPTTIEEM